MSKKAAVPDSTEGKGRGECAQPSHRPWPHPVCLRRPTPRGQDEAGMHRERQGDTHIWVLRAQCWLRGREGVDEGGETEKQKNRFVSAGSQARHQAGGCGLQRDTGTTTTPAPGDSQRGSRGKHLWPAWASTKPKPCSAPRTPPSHPGWLCPGTKQGLRLWWQPDPPHPGGGPRREARLAQEFPGDLSWPPCPG